MNENKNFRLSSVSKKEELETIAALPLDFVSVSIPSKRIDKLLTKRKNEHETAILVMQNALRQTNLSIAEEMRREFAVLKQRLEKLDNQMDLIINTELKVEDADEMYFTKEVFEKTTDKINRINDKKIKAAEDFYQNLFGLEKKRSKEFAVILRECFAQMHKIYYQMPHDLQDFFEHEILKLNQTTLANHRCYEYLRFHFKSQIQNALRMKIYEITECQKNAELYRRKSELRDLISAQMSRRVSSLTQLAVLMREGREGDEDNAQIEAKKMGSMLDTIDQTQNAEMWASQLHTTLDFVENNAKKLVDLFKDAVILVFNRFFEELQDMAKTVRDNTASSTEIMEIDEVAKEIYDPLLQNFVETYGCDLDELKGLWNSVTVDLEGKIMETYNFLNHCIHNLDAHFARMQSIQSLILRDLKNVIQKNDWETQISEKQINKTIDQLRQESTKEKLDQHLKEVDKILDSIGKTYSVQCKKEVKVIRKYMGYIEQEIDLVVAEMERFLKEHEHNEKDPTIQRKRGSQISINEDEERLYNLMPTQMKQCQVHVDAIFNWMFGLWEGVKLYQNECRHDMTNKAEAWCEKQVQKIEKRLEVKMAVHKPRYQRIRHVIYNKRLEEINAHLGKLEFLQQGVSKEMETAKDFIQSERVRNNSILKSYVAELEKIGSKLGDVQNLYQIKTYVNRLNVHTKNALAALTASYEESKRVSNEAQNKSDGGIRSFLQNIKLFGEGGNYNPAEVAAVRKRVAALAKTVPKKFAVISLEAQKDLDKANEEVKRMDGVIRERLARAEEEFRHNEWTVNKIRQLRNAIYHQVYDAKCKLRRVEAYSEAFEGALVNNALAGPEADYKLVVMEYKEAVEEVGKFLPFLLRPNIKEFKSKTVIINDPIENYVDELFSVVPIAQDGSLPSKLSYLIYESLEEIQEQAKKFYEGHPVIINKERVQPNFTAFMDEVMGNFLSYQLQCEYSWLECLHNLLHHNLDILNFVNHTYNKAIKDYLNEGLTNFKKTCDAIRKHVGQERDNIHAEYAKIKAKPEWYLDDIEDVLNKIHDNAKNRIDEVLIAPHKDQLERDFKKIKDDSKKIHQNFQELIEDEHFKNYTATLIDEFKDGIELIDTLLEIPLVDMDPEKVISVHTKRDSVIDETGRKVSLLKNWLESLDNEESRLEQEGQLVIFIKCNHQKLLHEYNKILTEFDRFKAWTDQMHAEYERLFIQKPPEDDSK